MRNGFEAPTYRYSTDLGSAGSLRALDDGLTPGLLARRLTAGLSALSWEAPPHGGRGFRIAVARCRA